MAEKKNQFGGPAFPQPAFIDPETGQTVQQRVEGMSIQTYAAIHLCVPMSEHPIINEMINKARLDRFAGQALSGFDLENRGFIGVEKDCSIIADSMIRSREASHE